MYTLAKFRVERFSPENHVLSTLKRFVLNRLTYFCIHADATQRGYFAKSRRQNLKWVKLETLNVKLAEYITIVPEGKTTTTTIIEAT